MKQVQLLNSEANIKEDVSRAFDATYVTYNIPLKLSEEERDNLIQLVIFCLSESALDSFTKKFDMNRLRKMLDNEDEREVIKGKLVMQTLETLGCHDVIDAILKGMPSKINHGEKKGCKIAHSLLDVMDEGREFESLFSYKYENLDLKEDLRRCIRDIEHIRQHPVVCYIADVLKPKDNTDINYTDDLPFREMIANVPSQAKEVDVILVTPGGIADQVNSFVNVLRPRFEKVNFILLDKAMSAGTMFIMSGDEIIMSEQSKFGPIDPQIKNHYGRFVPAQALLITLEEIRKRGEEKLKKGEQPDWTDLQLLSRMDPYEIGVAKVASQHAIEMVANFLNFYKLASWTTHKNGNPVLDEERLDRAYDIAEMLCDHSKWKNHGFSIDRVVAEQICLLKIIPSERIDGLDRALRRMWAVVFWIFESTPYAKFFLSNNYCITKRDSRFAKPQN